MAKYTLCNIVHPEVGRFHLCDLWSPQLCALPNPWLTLLCIFIHLCGTAALLLSSSVWLGLGEWPGSLKLAPFLYDGGPPWHHWTRGRGRSYKHQRRHTAARWAGPRHELVDVQTTLNPLFSLFHTPVCGKRREREGEGRKKEREREREGGEGRKEREVRKVKW